MIHVSLVAVKREIYFRKIKNSFIKDATKKDSSIKL